MTALLQFTDEQILSRLSWRNLLELHRAAVANREACEEEINRHPALSIAYREASAHRDRHDAKLVAIRKEARRRCDGLSVEEMMEVME